MARKTVNFARIHRSAPWHGRCKTSHAEGGNRHELDTATYFLRGSEYGGPRMGPGAFEPGASTRPPGGASHPAGDGRPADGPGGGRRREHRVRPRVSRDSTSAHRGYRCEALRSCAETGPGRGGTPSAPLRCAHGRSDAVALPHHGDGPDSDVERETGDGRSDRHGSAGWPTAGGPGTRSAGGAT